MMPGELQVPPGGWQPIHTFLGPWGTGISNGVAWRVLEGHSILALPQMMATHPTPLSISLYPVRILEVITLILSNFVDVIWFTMGYLLAGRRKKQHGK